jgi:hypothetical protein
VVAGPSPPPSPAAAPKATLRMCRVKQLAGFGARESWRCEGRPGRHGRRGAGSRTWPRGGGRCCSRPGSARRARPGPGRGRSLKEQPLVFSDPNPRSRELFCDPGSAVRRQMSRSKSRADLGEQARHRRAGSAARDHPHWPGRHGRSDHRADRPDGHSSRLPARPTAPDHHARPRLSRTNNLTRHPAGRENTPTSPRAGARSGRRGVQRPGSGAVRASRAGRVRGCGVRGGGTPGAARWWT